MQASTIPTRDDTEIRACIDALAHALRAKDIDALMVHYAPDVVTFDLGPPLHVQGVDAYRKNFAVWFASMQGPIDYAIHDLRITSSDDVAFCRSLSHVRGTRTSGENVDYWVRVTTGFRKIDGKWLVNHEHVSMPVDMGTRQAAVEGVRLN